MNNEVLNQWYKVADNEVDSLKSTCCKQSSVKNPAFANYALLQKISHWNAIYQILIYSQVYLMDIWPHFAIAPSCSWAGAAKS